MHSSSRPGGVERIDSPHGLPELIVGIYRGDKLERIVSMKDPRGRFCETYNEHSDGLTAHPVSSATRLASSSLRPE